MQQHNKKQRENKPSILLSQDENDLVFSLLGRGCQAMSTAVVQLFTTEPPKHSSWIKYLTGVVCLVRDNSMRSYYIRVYCLAELELVWEEELYESISISRPREFLVSFEGEGCMILLSFSSDIEANSFYKAMVTAVNRLKRSQNQSSIKSAKADTNPQNEAAITYRSAPGASQDNKEKKKTQKITKGDISNPTNFKHVAHIGWNNQKSVEWDKAKEHPHLPPPLPARNPPSTPSASPQLSLKKSPKAPLSKANTLQKSIQPVVIDSSAPPPPPPPPMPPVLPSQKAETLTNHSNSETQNRAPPAPVFDLQSALMDSIRNRPALKPVGTTSPVSRNRGGIKNFEKENNNLTANDRGLSNPIGGSNNRMASELHLVLAKRTPYIQVSSDEDEDSSDNDDWDD